YKDFSKKYKFLVTLPTGIHGGWVIFSVFTSIMLVFSQNKSLENKFFALIISLILLILASAMVLFVFKENKNFGLIIGFLWGIFGIIIKQSPWSNFSKANNIIFIGASILFIFVGILSVYIFKFFKEK
ncbi:MAG: hypothetical protein E7K66_09010, partial [Streptococcus mitis]|nr:hypothetical protein [Streptococcus mitis]